MNRPIQTQRRPTLNTFYIATAQSLRRSARQAVSDQELIAVSGVAQNLSDTFAKADSQFDEEKFMRKVQGTE